MPSLLMFAGRSLKTCVMAVACLSATAAFAQVVAPIPTTMEGPISAIVSDGGTGATMTVMGATIQVPASARIHSPTAILTIAQLLDVTTPLPGRTQGGFLGGTTITLGTVNPATGVIIANDVFVEPAENVIVGAVTGNGAALLLNGVPVVMLNDPRMPAAAPMNDLGFAINLADVPVGSPACAEGYYTNDGTGLFQAFATVFTGVRAANPAFQAAVTRAIGAPASLTLDVRGGISGLPATGAITVQVRSGARVLGTGVATRVVGAPTTAEFRFNGRVAAPLPTSVSVRVTAAGFTPAPASRTVNSAALPVR